MACKEVISDSTVFHKSVFPHQQPGLSLAVPETVLCWIVSCPVNNDIESEEVAVDAACPPAPAPDPHPLPVPVAVPGPCLVPHTLLLWLPDMLERPQMPPKVRDLISNFKHHPAAKPLPPKHPSCVRLPGALVEDANAVSGVVDVPSDLATLAVDAFDVVGDRNMSLGDICIPILDTMECVFSTTAELEPKLLKEALKRLDTAEWVGAMLKEINAHLWNGTWELAQLPPGRHAIGSQWVFKIKKMPEGLIKKYKGQLVAQGFSQVPGIHYGEIFVSTA